MSIVYGLRAAGDTEIRYVGMTGLSLSEKLADHKKKSRAGWPYGPSEWIAAIGDVEIVRLCNCPKAKARATERKWVERLHFSGNRLFNSHLVPRARQTGAAA